MRRYLAVFLIAGCAWGQTPSHVSVSAQILAKDGTLAVMLSDDEYAHLQALRQAVVAEENRLAVKYGADMGQVYVPAPCLGRDMGQCLAYDESKYLPERKADTYTFHGQFLLIEKATK